MIELPTTRDQIAFLHRRAGWGLRPGELDGLVEGGTEAALERLVDPDGAGVALEAGPWDGWSFDYDRSDNEGTVEQVIEALDRWANALLNSERPLEHQLAWFWHDHFAVSAQVVQHLPTMLQHLDLCRTLGGRGVALPGGSGTRLTVDLGAALLDGKIHWFCAHLVARPEFRPGRWWVAANAAHRGRWNLAPRAHPGDGLLDILDVNLSGLSWASAWRRLPSGDHVPHPGIRYNRTSSIQHSFDRLTPVRLDGQSIGRFRDISVRVEAEALQVVV